MNRRNALSRVAWMVGGTLSAPTIMAFLEGCKSSTDTQSTVFSVTSDQKQIIEEVAEIIIPKTDTPGAKEAKVGEFIEMMLKDCYYPKEQQSFLKGIDELASKNFLKLTPEEQTTVLTEVEKATFTQLEQTGKDRSAAKTAGKTFEEPGVPFFRLMKELTLLGYFTSEVGATQALAYVPIPGRYEGCVDLEPGQKAWAL